MSEISDILKDPIQQIQSKHDSALQDLRSKIAATEQEIAQKQTQIDELQHAIQVGEADKIEIKRQEEVFLAKMEALRIQHQAALAKKQAEIEYFKK